VFTDSSAKELIVSSVHALDRAFPPLNPTRLSPDRENLVAITVDVGIDVSVYDRETLEELDGVDIFEVEPPRGDTRLVMFDDRYGEIAPDLSALAPEASGKSPIEIFPTHDSWRYWVTAAGHEWACIEGQGLRGAFSVALGHSTRVQVAVEGPLSDDDHLVVALYQSSDSADVQSKRRLMSTRAQRSCELLGVPAGEFLLTLEEADGGQVLDHAQLVVDPRSEDMSITLVKGPPPIGQAVIALSWGSPEGLPHEASLLPLSLGASVDGVMATIHDPAASSPFLWGPLELPAGTYVLRLLPSGLVHEFHVDAGRVTEVAVTCPSTRPRTVDVRTKDGERPALSIAAWSAPATPGRAAARLGMHVIAAPENPLALSAPDGELLLLVEVEGYGIQEFTLTEMDEVVHLSSSARLSVRLQGLGEEVSLSWLQGIRVEAPSGEAMTPLDITVSSGQPDGQATGELSFDGESDVVIHWPRLRARGELRASEARLTRGQTQSFVLDPGSLWKAPRRR